MNKNIKRIFTASILSIATVSGIACAPNNSKIAGKIDKCMAEFVSSINNLDYVETTTETPHTGKIVETAIMQVNDKLLSENSSSNIENTIIQPTEKNDNFKLFILSDKPFVSLTSNDNGTSLNFSMNFSTEKIEESSNEISNKINSLILKRSILMIYANELAVGHINLSEDNKVAINAYINVINENSSFLNGNRGMVKNQLSRATDLANSNSNNNLVNYYIIKSGEALENRASKIDATISAVDSITNILELNLNDLSPYYNSKLTNVYENLINNIKSSTNNNAELAKTIANSLGFKLENELNQEKTTEITQNNTYTKAMPLNQSPTQTTQDNPTTNQNFNRITTAQNNSGQNQNNSSLKNNLNFQLQTNQNSNLNTSSQTNVTQQSNNNLNSTDEFNKAKSVDDQNQNSEAKIFKANRTRRILRNRPNQEQNKTTEQSNSHNFLYGAAPQVVSRVPYSHIENVEIKK